ncbi:hypothetical protein AJ80_02211 [Polytolypa hystricis UAMH7299]|uniref:DUF7053 domain-containing protein n=1 Tax=Polytolypa hystricis (strain UAMH7299) TaxID=1447883 RepID=A0A2B7YRV2_POLH7|nr:hypothetical protein AJ80_02211 [Polytolypa hystricis UAMH7299]
MFKRSIFTTVTPLPPYITRETVIETLHQHSEMIELNPLVIKHERCKPPPNAPADEFHCIWYELTDKVPYLPGISSKVSYKACFHDLPRGLQTHVYAPTGLDIREKWSVGGNMPGEPRETVELGLTSAPREGLYLREDVDMRCNILVSNFVKKTLKRAHAVLVDRLVVKADILKEKADKGMIMAAGAERHTSVRSTATMGVSPMRSAVSSSLSSPDLTGRFSGPYSSYDPKSVAYSGGGDRGGGYVSPGLQQPHSPYTPGGAISGFRSSGHLGGDTFPPEKRVVELGSNEVQPAFMDKRSSGRSTPVKKHDDNPAPVPTHVYELQ